MIYIICHTYSSPKKRSVRLFRPPNGIKPKGLIPPTLYYTTYPSHGHIKSLKRNHFLAVKFQSYCPISMWFCYLKIHNFRRCPTIII